MGIRQALNQNPKIASWAAGVITVLAVGFAVAQVLGLGERRSAPTSYYYTTDDGQTYFEDSADRATPFDHDGKPAVLCHVFVCDSGDAFVAYLERYPVAANGQPYQTKPENVATEVKRPGEPKWVSHDSDAGQEIVQITCPGGGVKGLTRVLP